MRHERGWGEHPPFLFKKKNQNSRSFEGMNSKFLIQCHVVYCTTYGYYDLVVSNNPEILLLLRCKQSNNPFVHVKCVWPTESLLTCQTHHCEGTGWRSALKFHVRVITSQTHRRGWFVRLRGEEANPRLFQKQESFSDIVTVVRGGRLLWRKQWCLMAVFIKHLVNCVPTLRSIDFSKLWMK